MLYKVLLIEDNPGDVDLIKYYLEQITDKKYLLEHVDTVKAAYKLLQFNVYDIVLSDVNLIDSQGSDTIETITHIAKDIPLIFLTGLDSNDISLSAIQLGAQDYLVKDDITHRLLEKSITYAIERHKSKIIIEAIAIRDDLTGLYNRSGLKIVSTKILEVAKRHLKGLGVVLIDVDQFKEINDTYGHAEGDKALVALSNILTETFRNSDIVSRFGGDEFVILFLCDGQCSSTMIRKRLLEHVANYNQYSLSDWELSISIGIKDHLSVDSLDLDDMIREADHLMYLDKTSK